VSETERQRSGRSAEDRAVRLIEAAGLSVLVRNYLCRMGELDIVAQSGAGAGAVLVIVEVRLRASADFGGAAASVTRTKQRRIVLATRHLLAARPQLQKLPIRFDVVVVPSGNGVPEWLRAAFDA
jgi:putative endonuclease